MYQMAYEHKFDVMLVSKEEKEEGGGRREEGGGRREKGEGTREKGEKGGGRREKGEGRKRVPLGIQSCC
jgi:hypothetical protein